MSGADTSGKTYICTVCKEAFKRHEHLIRHSRRHTHEKPFKCDTCGKDFARRDILSRHQIVHVPIEEREYLKETKKRTFKPSSATKPVKERISERSLPVCSACKSQSLRCDGATPCSSCQNRGHRCFYEEMSQVATSSAMPAFNEPMNPQSLQPPPQPSVTFSANTVGGEIRPSYKRQRADSSSSTMAANVLLQVAGSAASSPKATWTEFRPHTQSVSVQNGFGHDTQPHLSSGFSTYPTQPLFHTSGVAQPYVVQTSFGNNHPINYTNQPSYLSTNSHNFGHMNFQSWDLDSHIYGGNMNSLFGPGFGVFSGLGLSRPGSRPISACPSRAPSPSHDFDAPYESMPPADSTFSFLFKKSEGDDTNSDHVGHEYERRKSSSDTSSDRDKQKLPAITSMLHSGSRQIASNGGTSVSMDYMTRPPSPVISFPEYDLSHSSSALQALARLVDPATPTSCDTSSFTHVPTLTEDDRIDLITYVQAELPPAQILNFWTQLYFEKFHSCFPVLHKPNYSASVSPHILTLAVLSIGCQYMEPNSYQYEQHRTSSPFSYDKLPDTHNANVKQRVTSPITKLTKKLLKLEADSFFALQARLLIDILDLYTASSQDSMSLVERRRLDLITLARNRRLFSENYDEKPPDYMSTEGRWQILRRAEERRRLAWGIFIYDFYFANFFLGRQSPTNGHPKPLIDVREMRISVPCHESVWESATSADWAAVFEPLRIPVRTKTLSGIGRIDERGCNDYGIFCKTVLAIVEARMLSDINVHCLQDFWNLDDREFVRNAEMKSSQVFVEVLGGLERTHIGESVGAYLTSSNQWATEVTQRDALITVQFARLSAMIDLTILREVVATGCAKAIVFWATDSRTARAARIAALSSAKIIGLIQRSYHEIDGPNSSSTSSATSAFTAMIIYYSILTLWAFAQYHPSDILPLEEIQLDSNSPPSHTSLKRMTPVDQDQHNSNNYVVSSASHDLEYQQCGHYESHTLDSMELRWIERGNLTPKILGIGVLCSENVDKVFKLGNDILSTLHWGSSSVCQSSLSAFEREQKIGICS